MSNLYQSLPKDLQRRKQVEVESVTSDEASDIEDDEPIKVKSQNPQSPNPEIEKTDNVTEGFTGDSKKKKDKKDKKKKGPSESEKLKEKTEETGNNFFIDFIIAPNTDGMTLTQRAEVAGKLFIKRIFMILFLLIFGINIERAANQYANEQYFPTDITKPPYYPTPEEKKEYEDPEKESEKCEKNGTSIKEFRRPSQVYPTYLYYRGMKLPKGPCHIQGAETDSWQSRTTLQALEIWNFLKSVFTKTYNLISSFFNKIFGVIPSLISRFFKSAGKVEEEEFIAPEEDAVEKFLKNKEQYDKVEAKIPEQEMKEKTNLAEKEMAKEAKDKVPVSNTRRMSNPFTSSNNPVFSRAKPIPKQTGKGKPYLQSAGNKSAENFSLFKPPNHTYDRGYFGVSNPYAADKKRELNVYSLYPFWPLFAYGTRTTAIFVNTFYKYFLTIFKSKGEEDDSKSVSQNSLIQSFRIFGLLLYSLLGTFGSLMLGSLMITLSSSFTAPLVIYVLATNTAVLSILKSFGLLLPHFIIYSILLLFAVLLIMWGRTLYFYIFTFFAPLFSLDETLKELLRSIIDDRTGFFILSWALLIFSTYQVAPDYLQSRILLYGILIPIIFGVVINVDLGSSLDVGSPMNLIMMNT
jgi:hypothetical protein